MGAYNIMQTQVLVPELHFMFLYYQTLDQGTFMQMYVVCHIKNIPTIAGAGVFLHIMLKLHLTNSKIVILGDHTPSGH